jgi:hypothetical protein
MTGSCSNSSTNNQEVESVSSEKKLLSWEYVAAWFDSSGSVYLNHNEARLRFASYDRELLERIRVLMGGGSISVEPHSRGLYARLTISGRFRISRVLNAMLPFLQRKRGMVEDWLKLERVMGEIGSIQRRLSLKPGKRKRRELRHLKEAVRQLTPPEGQ